MEENIIIYSMEFDIEIFKALIRIAKKHLEFKGRFDKILDHFLKEKDLMAIYTLGCMVGILNAKVGTEFSVALEHNFLNIIKRISKGEDEDKLIEEFKMVMKEAIKDDFMLYGG